MARWEASPGRAHSASCSGPTAAQCCRARPGTWCSAAALRPKPAAPAESDLEPVCYALEILHLRRARRWRSEILVRGVSERQVCPKPQEICGRATLKDVPAQRETASTLD